MNMTKRHCQFNQTSFSQKKEIIEQLLLNFPKFTGIVSITLILVFQISPSVFAQRNQVIPPPYFWIKADSINHTENYMIDISRNNNNIYFSSPIDTGKINFQPSLKISTSVPFTIPYYPKSKGAICVFVVYKEVSSEDGYSIWSIKLDSSNVIEVNSKFIRDLYGKSSYGFTADSSTKISFFSHDWMNKKVDITKSSFMICGGDSVPRFNGLISEIIFYNRKLSEESLVRIFTYLAIKYGISLKEINYTSSDNTILWDSHRNSEYNNDIAGIGKDSRLNINQKQSAGNGGESMMKIFAGNSINDWNKENSFTINNGDFLIWGDNGYNFNSCTTDTVESDSTNSYYLNSISEKQWLMNRTGKSTHKIPTLIVLSAPQIARDTLKTINLVINRSSEFLFTIDSTIIIPADSIDTLGNFYFHNVYWDTDSSGRDAFTFQISNSSQISEEYTYRSAKTDFVDVERATHFNIYPNPSNGLFDVEINLNEPGIVFITVHDESGRIIYKVQLFNEQKYLHRIKINSKGVYIVTIEASDKKQNFQIVVQ